MRSLRLWTAHTSSPRHATPLTVRSGAGRYGWTTAVPPGMPASTDRSAAVSSACSTRRWWRLPSASDDDGRRRLDYRGERPGVLVGLGDDAGRRRAQAGALGQRLQLELVERAADRLRVGHAEDDRAAEPVAMLGDGAHRRLDPRQDGAGPSLVGQPREREGMRLGVDRRVRYADLRDGRA